MTNDYTFLPFAALKTSFAFLATPQAGRTGTPHAARISGELILLSGVSAVFYPDFWLQATLGEQRQRR